MELITLLQNNHSLAIIIFALLGLCIGSFLNVVIHRIPLQMFYEWRKECTNHLENEKDIGQEMMAEVKAIVTKDTPISLSFPPSRCPNCNHKIRWYENIPVISWLILLRGKCSGCKNPISIRYPIVEIITAILSALVIYKFGVNWEGISALVLVWVLIALAGIDFDTQLLPDRLTFPLAGMGLLVNSFDVFVTAKSAILGLVGGYLALWIVTKLYAVIKKIDGMGMGDFKLLAVLGAWLGVSQIPFIILLSTIIGSVAGIYYYFKNNRQSLPFAFGPYIAIAGIVALLYGTELVNWYLAMAMPS